MIRLHLAVLPVLASISIASLASVAKAGVLKVPQQFDTIQEAVTSAGAGDEVVVDDGTYNENVGINGKNDITIRGSGKVRVIGVPSFAPPVATFAVFNCTGVVMRNFRIEPPDGAVGVSLSNTTHSLFDRCRVDGGDTGFSVVLADEVEFRRCSSTEPTSVGFDVTGASAAIVDCSVIRAQGDGIVIGLDTAEIRGNRIVDCGDDALATPSAEHAVITDNTFDGVEEVAIGVGGDLIGPISGNRIKNVAIGIDGDNVSVMIENNSIQNATSRGIDVLSSAATTFRNRVKKCGTGMLVNSTSQGCVHDSNRITKCTGNGIEIELGAVEHLFIRNVVKKSGGFDLLDPNASSNSYIDNSFGNVGP